LSARNSITEAATARGLALAAALVAILVTCAAGPPAAHGVAASGSVSGTVTDALSGDPIAGIEVCAYSEEVEFVESDCKLTNADGEYEISNLPAAAYFVEFWGPQLNYLTQYWQDRSRFQDADPVAVGVGAVSGIDAAMDRGGRISGTVTLASPPHEAVAGIEVCAFTVSEEEGEVRCVKTNGAGEYMIQGLPHGTYKVEFWPGEDNLVPQYWDHVLRWEEATPVEVDVEATAEEIDAALAVGGVITGSVRAAEGGVALDGVIACARERTTGFYVACAESAAAEGGRYGIIGLPSGSYSVGFSEEFEPGFPVDGFDTQFFNQKTGFAEADPVPTVQGQVHAGVDAALTRTGAVHPLPLPAPPALSGTLPALAAPKALHCRKGMKKRKIRGKLRCVRRKHHRHHPRRSPRG
jgi:hypothetical protein